MRKDRFTWTEADRLTLLEKLPLECMAIHPHTGKAIMIKRGETGYWACAGGADFVKEINHARGITETQVAAMLHGSMYGFHTPGADPDHWQHTKKEGKP